MIYDFAKYGLASKSKVDSFNGIQTYRGRMTTICPIRDDFVVEISEPTEIVYVISITIIGILTILLSFLLLFLIIARSPKMTRENRIGLACLQGCFLLFSLHNCCLFQIVPALPFFAGYCVGILCRPLQVDFHILFVTTSFFNFASWNMFQCITILLTALTFAFFFICIFQRHQTIVLRDSRWKLGNCRFVIFSSVLTYIFIPITLFYANGCLSKEETDAKMKSYPAMAWLRLKPSWTVYSLAANSSLKYISALFVAYCITTGLMTTFLIVHTVTMIRRIPNQSKRAQDNIQRATVILFIQFGIFIVFLLVPVAIFNSQVLKVFEQMGAYPFLIAVVFFFSHGLFISIISIAMSKDHRLSIVIFLRPKENQITVLSPPSTDSPSRRRSSSKFV